MRRWWAACLIGMALPVPVFAQPAVTASPSTRFAESVGVNTHLSYKWDTAYGDCGNQGNATPPCPLSVARIGGALRQLGVRHIRDGFPAAYVAERARALAAIVPGLGIDFVISDDRSGTLQTQLGFAAPVDDLIDYVEGPNEPNNSVFHFRYHKHPFPNGALEEMRDLRALMSAGPLARVPLINIGLGGGTEADAGHLGVVPEAEFGNSHAYYGVHPPARFTRGLDPARRNAPGKPMVITETGNCTPAVRTEWCATSEAVQAKYTLMALVDAFDIGVARTYLYELVDEKPDPAGTDVEQHFGLFYPDWSPKPSGTALINLRSAVGTGTQSGSLAYTVEGARTVLLRRSDGMYLIIAWFDSELWDTARHEARDVPPRPFTLKLKNRPAQVEVFDPLDASRRRLDPGTSIKLELPDHPVVIEVKPS